MLEIIKDTSSVRKAMSLVGKTALAQVLVLVSAPLIARLYSPSD